MTEKIDLTREFKSLYKPSASTPAILPIPGFQFLSLDGSGDPNNSDLYQQTIQSLYQFAYTLKFAIKKANGTDFQVMPLEGLWWAENMDDFRTLPKSSWQWRMMIAQPNLVSTEWVETARKLALAKKDAAPRLSEVKFQVYEEGLSVQILYIGPYSAEGPTIQRLHEYARDQNYHLAGLHHEIYLSDPGRTNPEKLRTILRQPISH